MTDARKFEIGYFLLIQQRQREGLLLNTRFKQQLDDATATLNIPKEEMMEFALLIAVDVSATTDAAPV